MKRQVWESLTFGLRLRKVDILLTLVPVLLWWGAVIYGRQHWIAPRCANEPALCSRELVHPLDRMSLGLESPEADLYSEWTQDLSGGLAILAPLAWNVSLTVLGRATPMGALVSFGTDFVIFVQVMAANGVMTELSHFVSQRPRPFVYSDPPKRGTDPAHYTSFYSGHTSFAAAACTLLVLLLLARGAPPISVALAAGTGQCLIMMTAVFRVFAGRHFITDVVVATIMGTIVALAVAHLHRERRDVC